MNCIGTNLIAVLRLCYIWWNEQKSASRNAESLKQEVRRTEFSVKRGKGLLKMTCENGWWTIGSAQHPLLWNI